MNLLRIYVKCYSKESKKNRVRIESFFKMSKDAKPAKQDRDFVVSLLLYSKASIRAVSIIIQSPAEGPRAIRFNSYSVLFAVRACLKYEIFRRAIETYYYAIFICGQIKNSVGSYVLMYCP
jgi:hypothetical protein